MTLRLPAAVVSFLLALGCVGCCGVCCEAKCAPTPAPSAGPVAPYRGPLAVEAPRAVPPQRAEPATPAEATQARLAAFFEVVRAQVPAAAAPFIVYRGPDGARNWKDLANYANEDEKERVDGLFKETWGLLQLGAPRFLTFRSERESEGQWLVWQVAFGEATGAKTVDFAWLDVKGTLGLGDID